MLIPNLKNMYKIENIHPQNGRIKIEWNLGKRCNLDCSYCPPIIHDNFSSHTDISILKNTIDKLKDLMRPIKLSFTGGEPTVHPQIKLLIEYARDRIDWINVTTNGLRRPSWYQKLPVNHYVFSLHFDNKHHKRALKNILKFSQINNKEKEFFVNVMAHQDYMTDVKDSVDKLQDLSIKYAIRRIRWTKSFDNFDDSKYSKEDLNWIINQTATATPNCLIDGQITMHANDVIKKHLNQFKNWSCAAGIESLMINWDGDVHRATCRVGGSLGNIYKGTFKFPSDWITCTRNFCTCAADISLTKEMR